MTLGWMLGCLTIESDLPAPQRSRSARARHTLSVMPGNDGGQAGVRGHVHTSMSQPGHCPQVGIIPIGV
jgi:hypothetical protein